MSKEMEWLKSQAKIAKEREAELKAASAPKPATSPKPKGGGLKDVAGMEREKSLIREGLINVLQNMKLAERYGIVPPAILLYGPAGCGKTYFAEKVAEEVGINFMKVNPDDIASQHVHGTQELIGEVFKKAEQKRPTILFFDEFDAMVPQRNSEDHGLQNGEVNEFLCMLNNASSRGIYVMAATNYPERIDKAVLRTGRIDEIIYVPMPDEQAREELFRLSLSKFPLAENVDYAELAKRTQNYSCSDINYIVKKVGRKMFNIAIKSKGEVPITMEELTAAISHQAPSVSSYDLRNYERLRNEFAPLDERKAPVKIGFN